MSRLDGETSLGDQKGRYALLVIGFALTLCFNAFTLWKTASFFPSSGEWQLAAALFSTAAIIADVACFFLFSLGAFLRPSVFQEKPYRAGATLVIGGFALLLYAVGLNGPSDALLIVSGVFVGAGSACWLICWEQVFAENPGLGIRRVILAASVVTIVPYLLLRLFPQPILIGGLSFILIPACLITLRYAMKHPQAEALEDPSPRKNFGVYRGILSRQWVPLLSLLILGLVSPVLSFVALRGVIGVTQGVLLSQVGSIAAVIIIFLLWRTQGHYPSILRVCMVLFPVLAVSIFLFPFFGSGYSQALLLISSICFPLMSILMMVTCIDEAESSRCSLVVIYGLFAGVLYLSTFIGQLIGNAIAQSAYTEDIRFLATAFFMLYLLSLMALLAFRAWGRRQKETEKTVSNDEDHSLPTMDDFARKLDLQCASIALEYGLSDREAEVMHYLALGYTASAIAKELVLSENTIRTHIKRLYRSLDIHTKQELIEKVQTADYNG